jgi:hypothetical protein
MPLYVFFTENGKLHSDSEDISCYRVYHLHKLYHFLVNRIKESKFISISIQTNPSMWVCNNYLAGREEQMTYVVRVFLGGKSLSD